jgi:hypothetical protein
LVKRQSLCRFGPIDRSIASSLSIGSVSERSRIPIGSVGSVGHSIDPAQYVVVDPVQYPVCRSDVVGSSIDRSSMSISLGKRLWY